MTKRQTIAKPQARFAVGDKVKPICHAFLSRAYALGDVGVVVERRLAYSTWEYRIQIPGKPAFWDNDCYWDKLEAGE